MIRHTILLALSDIITHAEKARKKVFVTCWTFHNKAHGFICIYISKQTWYLILKLGSLYTLWPCINQLYSIQNVWQFSFQLHFSCLCWLD